MQVTYLILPVNQVHETLLTQFSILIPAEAIKKNVHKTCRICLREEDNLTSLYNDKRNFEATSMSISDAILDCFGVRISPDVRRSSFICSECVKKTQDAHTFKCTIVKAEKAIRTISQHIQSPDELAVNSFGPLFTEDLSTLPSGTEVNKDEIKSDICTVTSKMEMTPLKRETIVSSHSKSSPALDATVKDKGNKPFVSTTQKLLAKSSNTNSRPKNNRNKKNKSTVLSSSQLKMNVKRTYTRNKKEKNVPPSLENQAHIFEHNYTKSINESTAWESPNESKPDEEPSTELKIKKHSNCSSADSMAKWWIKASGPPYQCKLCERNYGSQYSVFSAHVHTHFMKKYPCTICGKRFFRDKLRLHMRSHTTERPFSCDQCPARFIVLAKLRRHLISHKGEKPSICEQGFADSTSLQTHMDTHNETSTCVCEICGITLTKNSYRTHKSKYHRVGKTAIESNERFPCDKCDKVFSKLQSLTRHYKVHKSVTYKCKMCNATFEESYSFEVHSFIHEIQLYNTYDIDTKPFRCKFCLNIYNTKIDLAQHVLTHMKNPYKCKNCDQSFRTKLMLTDHMQKYCDSKPFPCSGCGKAFKTSAALYQHRKIRAGVKTYICQVCDRAFLQSHQLMDHMLTHTRKKKFVCPYCGKAFGLKGSLTVHVRRHSGETPNVCKVCNTGFYDSTSCKKHMRKKHRIELVADASSSEVNAT